MFQNHGFLQLNRIFKTFKILFLARKVLEPCIKVKGEILNVIWKCFYPLVKTVMHDVECATEGKGKDPCREFLNFFSRFTIMVVVAIVVAFW